MAKKEIRRIIRPQSQVELILAVDLMKENIDVRSTIIYDLKEGKHVVLGQTSPPILKSMVGRKVEPSFLIRDPDTRRRRRLGYETKILKFDPKYKLRSGGREQAVIIGYPKGKLKSTSVRLHYRVSPTAEYPMEAAINGSSAGYNIVDLSLGGILVACRERPLFVVGNTVRVDLEIRNRLMNLEGEVVRIFDRDGSPLTFMGIRFLDPQAEQARIIQATVGSIMRDELKARSGLGGK